MRCENKKKTKKTREEKSFMFPFGKKQILFNLNFLKSKNSKAQIWVETVIYTLIAFAMIGLVLSYAKPKIEEYQDKAIIDQTIEVMNQINSIILSIDQGGFGNKRKVDLNLKKGNLKIDGANDKIVFEIETKCKYSEEGQEVNLSENLIGFTKKKGKFNIVNLTRSYKGYDLEYDFKDESKTIPASPTKYSLFISNEGENKTNNKTMINFEIN